MEYLEKYKTKNDIVLLYEGLKWLQHIPVESDGLIQAMEQSWYVVYVYKENKLIGTGRVVSDGLINAYICGIGVCESYRGVGVGNKILNMIVAKCMESKLSIQLLCSEELVPYYEKKGFDVFTVGMKHFKA